MSHFCRCFVKVDCRRLVRLCRTTIIMNIYEPRDDSVTTAVVVSTFSPVRTNWRQSLIRQLVAVDFVAVVEHAFSKAGNFCCPNVERPFDIRSTFSNSTKSKVSNWTFSPAVCTGPYSITMFAATS